MGATAGPHTAVDLPQQFHELLGVGLQLLPDALFRLQGGLLNDIGQMVPLVPC